MWTRSGRSVIKDGRSGSFGHTSRSDHSRSIGAQAGSIGDAWGPRGASGGPKLRLSMGKYTSAVADMARRAGFRSAVAVSHSLASATSERYALPRCAMRGGDSMLDFMLTVRIGYGLGSVIRFARRRLGV